MSDPRHPKANKLFNIIECNSVFISDPHTLTVDCLATDLKLFLERLKFKNLFVVGDFMDCWIKDRFSIREAAQFFFDNSGEGQASLFRTISRLPRKGVHVHFILGNHEDSLYGLIGKNRDNLISVHESYDYETLNHERYRVEHGDGFDGIIKNFRDLSVWSTRAYEQLSKISHGLNYCRKNTYVNDLMLGLGLGSHWSLAAKIKSSADQLTYTTAYETAMRSYLFDLNKKIFENKKPGPFYQGIIAGHTHIPMEMVFPSPLNRKGIPMGPPTVTYWNTGHWTANAPAIKGDETWRDKCKFPPCTAVIEDLQGKLQLVIWDPRYGIRPFNTSRVTQHLATAKATP